MRYIEDRLIAAPWSTAISILTLFLAVCASLLWLNFARDLQRYLEPAPVPAAAASVPLSIGADVFALPREAIRFPSPALIAKAKTFPLPGERIELQIEVAAGGGAAQPAMQVAIAPASPARLIDMTLARRKDAASARERLERLFAPHFTGADIAGPDGLTGRRLGPGSAFAGETVYVLPGAVGDAEPVLFRCSANAGALAPATCYRTLEIGADTRLEYRFAASLLSDWRAIETDVRRLIARARAAGG